MNKRHFTYLLPAVLLLLSACAHDDIPALQEVRQLTFTVTDGGYASGANAGQAGAPATRAVEKGYATTFTTGDECGLYVVRGTETVYANVKLAAFKNGVTGVLMWQTDGNTTLAGGLTDEKYYLYYPYQADMTGKTATLTGTTLTDAEFFKPLIDSWQPGDDQSTYAQYTASDLMTAAGTAVKSADKINLSFSTTHRMALAVIEMPKVVYKFTNEQMTDYTAYFSVAYTSSARPLNRGDGTTYRHLVNPNSTTMPVIKGSYDDGGKEFTITPSGIAAGNYKTYKVDGAKTETKEHQLQVGDFFLADGRLLSKDADASVVQAANVVGIVFQTDPDRIGAKEKEKLGGNARGLVMSVKNAATSQWWGPYGRDEGLTKRLTKADNYDDISGYGNCEHIRDNRDGFGDYPAFKAADGYNASCPVPASTTGWYLPSSGQLWDILRNLGGCPSLAEAAQQSSSDSGDFYWSGQGDVPAALNAWMQKIAAGGKNDFGSYAWLWSSSEYSDDYARDWYVDSNGRVHCGWYGKGYGNDVRPVLAF